MIVEESILERLKAIMLKIEKERIRNEPAKLVARKFPGLRICCNGPKPPEFLGI